MNLLIELAQINYGVVYGQCIIMKINACQEKIDKNIMRMNNNY